MQVYAAPAMTFQADTLEWCKPFSLPELALMIIFLAFSATVCLTGVAAVDPGGYFGFYTGLVTLAAFVYTTCTE